MKKQTLLLATLILFLLQGCIVKSLHPFFNESDVVFKPELLNSWIDDDGNKWVIRQIKDKPNAYEMHWLHQGERDVVFVAHLFQLNNELYLDFMPVEDDRNDTDYPMFTLHLMPVHSVARVYALNENEVVIKWFNEKWLKSLFEQNRIKVSHEVIVDTAGKKDDNDKTYVLTAATGELQKFLVKYGDEDAAFDDGNTVSLVLKRDL